MLKIKLDDKQDVNFMTHPYIWYVFFRIMSDATDPMAEYQAAVERCIELKKQCYTMRLQLIRISGDYSLTEAALEECDKEVKEIAQETRRLNSMRDAREYLGNMIKFLYDYGDGIQLQILEFGHPVPQLLRDRLPEEYHHFANLQKEWICNRFLD